MNIATFSFIIIGVLLNAVAQLLLKAGARNVGEIHLTLSNLFSVGWRVATQLPIIGGLTCYVLSVVLWIIALSRVDVSVAYPMWSPPSAPGTCLAKRCRYSDCLPFSSSWSGWRGWRAPDEQFRMAARRHR
jgi:multidrug transporter EmrE-like cation transporter